MEKNTAFANAVLFEYFAQNNWLDASCYDVADLLKRIRDAEELLDELSAIAEKFRNMEHPGQWGNFTDTKLWYGHFALYNIHRSVDEDKLCDDLEREDRRQSYIKWIKDATEENLIEYENGMKEDQDHEFLVYRLDKDTDTWTLFTGVETLEEAEELVKWLEEKPRTGAAYINTLKD